VRGRENPSGFPSLAAKMENVKVAFFSGLSVNLQSDFPARGGP
jgi:hypothetical protein